MRESNRGALRGRAIAVRAAPLFLTAALCFAADDGHAQNNQAELVQEIIRKASAQEDEAGFCATTGWRLETSETHDANIQIYERGRVGSSKTFLNQAPRETDYCAYLRIAQVFREDGRRCVRTEVWYCSVGNRCGFNRFKGCRAEGTWKWTSQ